MLSDKNASPVTESAVMDGTDGLKTGLRKRTVKAVTDCELCFMNREGFQEVCDEYLELKARLQRYATFGAMRLTKKALRKVRGGQSSKCSRRVCSLARLAHSLPPARSK